MRIAIAVFDGAEELDFVGPWEVPGAWRLLYPDDVELVLVGDSSAPVTCAKGMQVRGRGTRPQLGNETIRARLRALEERGTLMTSVCTGALLYADAGLLDGRSGVTSTHAQLAGEASLGTSTVKTLAKYTRDLGLESLMRMPLA